MYKHYARCARLSLGGICATSDFPTSDLWSTSLKTYMACLKQQLSQLTLISWTPLNGSDKWVAVKSLKVIYSSIIYPKQTNESPPKLRAAFQCMLVKTNNLPSETVFQWCSNHPQVLLLHCHSNKTKVRHVMIVKAVINSLNLNWWTLHRLLQLKSHQSPSILAQKSEKVM